MIPHSHTPTVVLMLPIATHHIVFRQPVHISKSEWIRRDKQILHMRNAPYVLVG